MRRSIRGSGSSAVAAEISVREDAAIPAVRHPAAQVLSMLWRDKFALGAAVVLLSIVLCALLGPDLVGDLASKQNLRGRNAPPFELGRGWAFMLGADALGRPILPRIMVAA